MIDSVKAHWNRVYSANPVEKLGWYEDVPQVSLEMIANCSIRKDEAILDVGAGATTLIDHLFALEYQNLTALDISAIALDKLRKRLGADTESRVQWIIGDITHPSAIFGLKDIAIWHDRAALHFLTDEDQQRVYLSALKKVLKIGGHVIIAAFSMDGAAKCSGLDVKRYDANSLAAFLGDEFDLKESTSHLYRMPSGDPRPFVYTRFQRLETA